MGFLSDGCFPARKSFVEFLLGAALVALAGCTISPINLSESGSIAQGEGIVAGSVRLLDEGEAKSLSSVFGESQFGLFVTGTDTSAALFVPLKGEGDFIWHLPEGAYQITGFEWRSGITLSGPIGANFRVVEGQVAYVGTLELTIHGPRYIVKINDEMESTANMIARQFPDLRHQVTKGLMTLEERR